MNNRLVSAFVIILLMISAPVQAEEFLTSDQVKKILEEEGKTKGEISSVRKILFWSKPDHPEYTHSYHRFANAYTTYLKDRSLFTECETEG